MLFPMFWTNILPQSCHVTRSSDTLVRIYHTTQHQISFMQAVCFKDTKHIHRRGLFKKGVLLKTFLTCFLFSAPLLHTQSITTFFTNSTGKIIQILFSQDMLHILFLFSTKSHLWHNLIFFCSTMNLNLNTHPSHLKVKSELNSHVSYAVCEHIPADMPDTSFGQRAASGCEPSHPDAVVCLRKFH